MHNLDGAAIGFDFLAPLRRARLYSVGRGIILAVLWSAAASLVTLKAAPLFPQLSGRPVDVNGTAAFVVATALVIGMSLAFGRPADLGALARQADRQYGLGERLSTIITLTPGTGGRRAALDMALRRDAAQYVGQIEPYRLSPLLDRSVGVAVIVLAAALALSFATPNLSVGPVNEPVASTAPLIDAQARAENIKAIADILAADAEKRDNSYLRQVADAVSRLASEPNLGGDASQDELTGLLDNARLAYGKTAPSWLLQDLAVPGNKYGLARDRNFAALAERATAANLPDARGGSGEEMVPELLSEQNLQHEATPAPLPGQLQLAPADDSGLATSSQNIGGNPASSEALSGQARAGAEGGAPPSLGDADAAAGTVDAAAAILAGGATQSGQGASRTAGGGTQALDDPDRAVVAPMPASEDVLLPPSQYKPGKRIRVQVTPPTGSGASADSQGHAIAADGSVQPAPVTRDTPSVRDQGTFSRFFTHDEAGGGG